MMAAHDLSICLYVRMAAQDLSICLYCRMAAQDTSMFTTMTPRLLLIGKNIFKNAIFPIFFLYTY